MEVIKHHKNITIDQLNEMLRKTLSEQLGMEVVGIGADYLDMRMPVDHRTVQPYGILNGGASMALAESVASLAANLSVDASKMCVGLEINGNHLKPVSHGWVIGRATPLHVGNKTQVWSVVISNEKNQPVCICRMTLAVLDKKEK